ncbi:MAG: peptide chain release factor N(5)-glutamine methyltransferase [Bacteroides sp.]|nr:peptide chain release factor N(5)-glutamine methyltransferase [Bacteroides sp.]
MTVNDLMKRMRDRLVEAGYSPGEAKGVALIVMDHLKGWSPSDVVLNGETDLDQVWVDGADRIIACVASGEPVQYVIGKARFYGMDLTVTPDVLIPRPETEELVDLIVKENPESDLRVLDIGTGSGCIAIALARNLRFPIVSAIDISQKALAVAMKNATDLKTKIRFEEDDVFHFNPAPESFDIIVSNPPYICEKEKADMEPLVLDHEPASALFVPDDDPLLFYRRIAMIATGALVPGGRLYFEINPLYATEMQKLLAGLGFVDIQVTDDIERKPRFVSASKKKTED